jgi:predicted 2-oxoglutarate/Fe(II)-dependent dioxygenase YbiX
MLISIEKVLSAPAVAELRAALSSADAPWVDGRITAGY